MTPLICILLSPAISSPKGYKINVIGLMIVASAIVIIVLKIPAVFVGVSGMGAIGTVKSIVKRLKLP